MPKSYEDRRVLEEEMKLLLREVARKAAKAAGEAALAGEI